MEIRFLDEWMGNQPGSTRDIIDHVAERLIERGTAELLTEEKEPRRTLGRPKAQAPKKDKMVKGAKNK